MQYYRHEQGAVLIMATLLLLVLTIVAVSFARISSLEMRGAKNYSDSLSALSIAENALLDAEAAIEALADPDDLSGSEGFYASNTAPDPFGDNTWESGVAQAASNRELGSYYVESVMTLGGEEASTTRSVSIGGYGEDTTQTTASLTIFRSVVRAQSASGTAVFMIESFYGREF